MTEPFSLLCTGREVYHLGPSFLADHSAPTIQEIAHSLSIINRFNGHTCRPFSVAEHSLLVADICAHYTDDKAVIRAALFHDAHEAILGDITAPVKALLGPLFHEYDQQIQANTLLNLGLSQVYYTHQDLIRVCDLRALATERRDLMAYVEGQNTPWASLENRAPWPERISLETPDWHTVKEEFLRASYNLITN